jgi:hypothetical protein
MANDDNSWREKFQGDKCYALSNKQTGNEQTCVALPFEGVPFLVEN